MKWFHFLTISHKEENFYLKFNTLRSFKSLTHTDPLLSGSLMGTGLKATSFSDTLSSLYPGPQFKCLIRDFIRLNSIIWNFCLRRFNCPGSLNENKSHLNHTQNQHSWIFSHFRDVLYKFFHQERSFFRSVWAWMGKRSGYIATNNKKKLL